MSYSLSQNLTYKSDFMFMHLTFLYVLILH